MTERTYLAETVAEAAEEIGLAIRAAALILGVGLCLAATILGLLL